MHERLYALHDVLIVLFVSIVIVVLSRRFKLSPVLGYLIVGAIVGQHGYDLLLSPKNAAKVGEFGVVFLLFTIGLELTIERLIKMRLYVFGFGGLQVILSTVALAFSINYYFHFTFPIALMLGASLTLSSTAVVLEVLAESRRQSTQVGRLSLAVLLMQDLAVVPLLAVLPMMSQPHADMTKMVTITSLKALAVVLSIIIIGRIVLRPFFTIVSSTKSDDIYVPTTFLLVLGASVITECLGLSEAMGAFLAGLLIAETEYRYKIEHSIMPFKSLLLGLFFMSIGMTLNVDFIIKNWKLLLIGSAALTLVKGVVITMLCKIFRFRWGAAIHSGLLLSQGGEFAFVLLSIALKQKIIPGNTGQLMLMIVAITMAITPILSILGAYIEDKFSADQQVDSNLEFKGVSDLDKHVIIAGFGRVGRVVAYMLASEKINYIAVDGNISLVKKARNQGFPIYHGDPSNIDTLKSVGAGRALAIIITMDDKLTLRTAIKTISKNYKNLCIISRVEDYRHGIGLRKLGANITVPSTIETGIQLGIASLQQLGIPYSEISSIKEKIRDNHYSLVEEVELFRGIVNNGPANKPSSDVKSTS